jgi:hypothetical protein
MYKFNKKQSIRINSNNNFHSSSKIISCLVIINKMDINKIKLIK